MPTNSCHSITDTFLIWSDSPIRFSLQHIFAFEEINNHKKIKMQVHCCQQESTGVFNMKYPAHHRSDVLLLSCPSCHLGWSSRTNSIQDRASSLSRFPSRVSWRVDLMNELLHLYQISSIPTPAWILSHPVLYRSSAVW